MSTEQGVAASSRLATPELLARIAGLELRARAVVEGVISGMHRSPHRGYSVEFAQHRDYTPGDEIRHIDWRVYGRSDRYYVKQFEEETNLRAYLALDASNSMRYGSGAMTKLEYASTIAAALAGLLMRQRDSVGLALCTDSVAGFLPPSATAPHMREILRRLEQVETAPRTDTGKTFHDLAERIRRRGLVIILSDLLDDAEAIVRGLQHFRHNKHDVIVFHIIDRYELTFPFRETVVFEGMEEEGMLPADPNALRTDYLRLMEEHITALRKGCREMAIDYVQMPTDAPLDSALAHYLADRSRTA
jgi:uncharacterized protein (DUF58 family)